MPVLSAASVVQAKTGSVLNTNPATIALDTPTQGGGTVTLELAGPIAFPNTPDGWDYDGNSNTILWAFHRNAGPGETSWQFDTGFATDWLWRVTEWSVTLDPVSPLEAAPATGFASGTGVTTLSTGTSVANARAETVALAWHYWRFVGTSAQAFGWGSHTGGFTVRDELRLSGSTTEYDACWSWLFNASTGAFECTATATTTPRHAGDTFYGMLLVYAATQPVLVAPPGGVMS